MEYGGGGLPAVDNLQVFDAGDLAAVVCGLHFLCGCGDAVVVGEKHGGFVEDAVSYALVHFVAGLEECAHILFQQSCAEFFIELREDFCGHDNQVGLV